MSILVEFVEAINPEFFVRLAVMLQRLGPIVIVGHVGCRRHHVGFFPRESMRSHVFFVLFQNNGSTWNQETGIMGWKHRFLSIIIIIVVLSIVLVGEQINIAWFKPCLTVQLEYIIDTGSQNARTGREQRVLEQDKTHNNKKQCEFSLLHHQQYQHIAYQIHARTTV